MSYHLAGLGAASAPPSATATQPAGTVFAVRYSTTSRADALAALPAAGLTPLSLEGVRRVGTSSLREYQVDLRSSRPMSMDDVRLVFVRAVPGLTMDDILVSVLRATSPGRPAPVPVPFIGAAGPQYGSQRVSAGPASLGGTTLQRAWIAGGFVSSILLAYHGYKRTQSVLWSVLWSMFGSALPFVALPVAFAQGFGKPKAAKANRGPSRRRNSAAPYARLVRRSPDDQRRVYELSHGVDYWPHDGRQRWTNWVVVDRVPYGKGKRGEIIFEAIVVPATAKGRVVDWTELALDRDADATHESALARLGFSPLKTRVPAAARYRNGRSAAQEAFEALGGGSRKLKLVRLTNQGYGRPRYRIELGGFGVGQVYGSVRPGHGRGWLVRFVDTERYAGGWEKAKTPREAVVRRLRAQGVATRRNPEHQYAYGRCIDCGGPAHEASGTAYRTKTGTVLVCGPCTRRVMRWVLTHTSKRPSKKHQGKSSVSFYEAAGRKS